MTDFWPTYIFTQKVKLKFRHISVRYIIAYSDCILFRNSLNNWIFFLSSASFFLLSEQKRKSNIRIIFIQWGIILPWNSNIFKKKIPKNNFEGKYWINMEELKGFKRWNAVRWPIETLNRETTWPLWPLGGRSQFHHRVG